MKRKFYLSIIITLSVVFATAQAGVLKCGKPGFGGWDHFDSNFCWPPETNENECVEPVVEQLTTGDINNSNIAISGAHAVWQGREPNGGPWQIFFYDGNAVSQVTDGNTDSIRPQIYGSNIVWQGRDASNGHWEIFWSNGRCTFQITDSNFDNINPRVSASRIFWKALDANGWQIFTAAFPVGVHMKVSPGTINLKSKGQSIMVAIWLGNNLKADDVVVSSLRLQGQAVPSKAVTITGSNKLIVKFDRPDIRSLLQTGNNVGMTLTGKMRDGTYIAATDTVKVIKPGR